MSSNLPPDIINRTLPITLKLIPALIWFTPPEWRNITPDLIFSETIPKQTLFFYYSLAFLFNLVAYIPKQHLLCFYDLFSYFIFWGIIDISLTYVCMIFFPDVLHISWQHLFLHDIFGRMYSRDCAAIVHLWSVITIHLFTVKGCWFSLVFANANMLAWTLLCISSGEHVQRFF